MLTNFLAITTILAGQSTKQTKMRISIPLMIVSSLISFGTSSTSVRSFRKVVDLWRCGPKFLIEAYILLLLILL